MNLKFSWEPDDEELIKEKLGELNSKILHYDSLGFSASFIEWI